MKNKKILITGGAGYIGSHTTYFLIDQGFDPSELIIFDNLKYGHREFLPPGVTFVKGDLLEKQKIESVFKQHEIDAVIHFAAYAYVGESIVNPGKYFQNNILGGLNLLESMAKHKCKKIIFSSSCAVFGIPLKGLISELTPKLPINPYGESKLIFESILDWYYKIYDLKYVVLRYFNAAGAAYGIGESHTPETHLIPLILKVASQRSGSIYIYGDDYDTPDGTCIRDYIHVLDLASAHKIALARLDKGLCRADYNLGTGSGHSVLEVIELCKNVTKVNVEFKIEGRRRGDPPKLIADPNKANKELKWKAKNNLKNIINDAWKWHQKYNINLQ